MHFPSNKRAVKTKILPLVAQFSTWKHDIVLHTLDHSPLTPVSLTALYPPAHFISINNGNRTEWSPIQSVIIQVIIKSRTTTKWESDLSVTSMITE